MAGTENAAGGLDNVGPVPLLDLLDVFVAVTVASVGLLDGSDCNVAGVREAAKLSLVGGSDLDVVAGNANGVGAFGDETPGPLLDLLAVFMAPLLNM